MNRRLALLWALAPLSAVYVWACSSDDTTTPSEQDGGSSTSSSSSSSSSGGGSSSSSGGSSSSSSGGPSDAGDAGGDAGNPLTCVGNPLTADGGTPDGGAILASDGGGPVRTAVVSTDTFVDGPAYTDLFAGGSLVYSEVFGFGHRVVRVGPDGGTPTFFFDSPGNGANQSLPIGNAVKGSFILTTIVTQGGPTASQILQTRPDGGAGPAITFPGALNVNDPNDLVVAKNGNVYFTDPAYQSGATNTGVYRVAADGGVSLVKAYSTNTGDKPDGIALSPDEKTLYVGFGLNKRIDRFTIDANGNATLGTAFPATFTDNPEGLATDSGGNLWVAEAPDDVTENGGRVSVWDPAGKKWGEIRFPDYRPIGVAFGGSADNKALYILANRYTGNGTSGYDAYVFIYNMRCAGTR